MEASTYGNAERVAAPASLGSVESLAVLTRGRENNFNLLRFLAASLVIYGHAFALSGAGHDPLARFGLTCGTVAVDSFFVISGFLVVKSLTDRKTLGRFLRARALRIFPGLFVAVSACAVVVGPLFSTLSLAEYFASSQWHRFIFANTTLILRPIRFHLPGVFESNPLGNAVNGSLWTLPWEIRMYLVVAGLGLAYRVLSPSAARRVFTWGVYALAGTGLALNVAINSLRLADHSYLLEFLSMFFVGGALFLASRRVVVSTWGTLGMVGLLLLLAVAAPGTPLVVAYNVLSPYLVLCLAAVFRRRLGWFNRFGDYSYGLYIYAFPIQQAWIAIRPDLAVYPYFVYASLTTLAAAVLSWHLVEKPAMRFKR